jgi:polysaccharide biosynthesis/export protein
MRLLQYGILVMVMVFFVSGCLIGDIREDVVIISDSPKPEGLKKPELDKINEIKEASKGKDDNLRNVIQATSNYTIIEYLSRNPEANNPKSMDFSVGGYDVIDITVYEEPDLSRENVRISADGYISFPLVGRVKVDGLTTSGIESLLSSLLAQGEYLLNAHVSVTVKEFRSKQFMVLGSVKSPGSYPLQAKERVLDAISKAGGIDFDQGGKEAMIIRTENSVPTPEHGNKGGKIVKENEKAGDDEKIVIRMELNSLLKGGDQISNILLADKDLIYIPRAESFYIIGQVQKPGSYPYMEKEITLVEAITKAGGFTPTAARNKTRIVRVEDGVEKIIVVKVDAIIESGQKGKDVLLRPGDVIVVPESFF